MKCVYDLYAALDIPIIGVGGISTWQDAVEMMMAGASAVQIGSAVCGGISVFAEISDGIEGYCRMHGREVSDICGIAHEM